MKSIRAFLLAGLILMATIGVNAILSSQAAWALEWDRGFGTITDRGVVIDLFPDQLDRDLGHHDLHDDLDEHHERFHDRQEHKRFHRQLEERHEDFHDLDFGHTRHRFHN